jgi:hypothetical protein
MFRWTHVESMPTPATAAQIWRKWAQVEDWPAWDRDLLWARLDGPFAAGSSGRMKPAAGPAVRFVLTRVVEGREFVDRGRLPLTRLEFRHVYEPDAQGGGRILHQVTMTGLLAPVFARLVGRRIKAGLRHAMERLSETAAADAC